MIIDEMLQINYIFVIIINSGWGYTISDRHHVQLGSLPSRKTPAERAGSSHS